mmetsp:Transcript_11793/g.19362  ORF Transcript_11793/g.19362 Transcript_11793/m.19362 type:complete len:207 (+) Transcript_11793:234-854(+)
MLSKPISISTSRGLLPGGGDGGLSQAEGDGDALRAFCFDILNCCFHIFFSIFCAFLTRAKACFASCTSILYFAFASLQAFLSSSFATRFLFLKFSFSCFHISLLPEAASGDIAQSSPMETSESEIDPVLVLRSSSLEVRVEWPLPHQPLKTGNPLFQPLPQPFPFHPNPLPNPLPQPPHQGKLGWIGASMQWNLWSAVSCLSITHF